MTTATSNESYRTLDEPTQLDVVYGAICVHGPICRSELAELLDANAYRELLQRSGKD